jgi:hypothetical protein
MKGVLSMIRTSSILEKRTSRSFLWLFLFLFLLIVSGCGKTALYTINIRYEPTKAVPAADPGMIKRIWTVANFVDARTVDDPLKIGYVLRPEGRKIFILPDKVKAPEAVAAGVRDYLYKAGYSLSGVRPEWNLQDGTINGDWGDILIGGAINKLEIICDDSQPLSPVQTYSAVVNLGIVLADVAARKVVYKTSVEGSASLKDVSFSVDKLEKQLNGALSEVIERLFTGAEFQEQLKKATAKP